jgi:hypothetical protein
VPPDGIPGDGGGPLLGGGGDDTRSPTVCPLGAGLLGLQKKKVN